MSKWRQKIGFGLLILWSAFVAWIVFAKIAPRYPAFFAAALGLLTLTLTAILARWTFVAVKESRRGWRIRPNAHLQLGVWSYEEKRNGQWTEILIHERPYSPKAPHTIELCSPEGWNDFPDWARTRRSEIISRIKSELSSPDFTFREDHY